MTLDENAARLAQLGEHWSAEQEVVASNPNRTNNPGVFRKLV